MQVEKSISCAFDDFIFDWNYETYLSVGGYGSGKSYHIAFKIILKCLEEVRKVLVVREVYETMKDSCYDLFKEILGDLNMLGDEEPTYKAAKSKGLVYSKESPLELKFPNGSKIIFKGMDKPAKLKSLNGVSIVWLEECSEIKYDGYKELLGRIRTPKTSMHFILSCNPVGRENWVYRHFFKSMDDEGNETVIVDEFKFYEKKCLVKNNTYYLHTTVDDNPYVPKDYIKRLDNIKAYDYPLYLVARHGRFGAAGTRVLPQFEVADNPIEFKNAISKLSISDHYFGFDFGFEESFNALVSMAVDKKNKILYIYDEIYLNHVDDSVMARRDDMVALKKKMNDWIESKTKINPIVADNADPKAISYYRRMGYHIRACRNKFAGSRLSNTRKVKRFRKIICSPKCKNTIRELKDLTYAKDSKGNVVYDSFNIDPHTFSAIWYGLDNYTVADEKQIKVNSRKGA